MSGFSFGCSVVTGLEKITIEELKEKLDITAQADSRRGKIFFKLSSLDRVHELTKLRSVEHVFAVVHVFNSDEVYETTELAERFFMRLPESIDWKDGLKSWSAYYDKSGYDVDKLLEKSVLPENYEPQFLNGKKQRIPGIPAFRVTANRTGEREGAENGKNGKNTNNVTNDEIKKHSFTSDQVAKWFGAAVNNKFGWQPNMKNFDMEVVIYVNDSRVLIGLLLTHEALHRRNISAFGHTTLNSCIAFGLGQMCKIKTGDIVIDPMCGTGAIPIECCAYRKNDIYSIGSELSHNPAEKARTNLEKYPKLFDANSSLSMDVGRFDARRLPLKTASVDVAITDLPFGVRVGSKKDNQELYPKVLLECARVVKPGTGRAALLTQDKRNFIQSLAQCKEYWYVANNPHINMGGMTAAIFVLTRSDKEYSEVSSEGNQQNKNGVKVVRKPAVNGYDADVGSSSAPSDSERDSELETPTNRNSKFITNDDSQQNCSKQPEVTISVRKRPIDEILDVTETSLVSST